MTYYHGTICSCNLNIYCVQDSRASASWSLCRGNCSNVYHAGTYFITIVKDILIKVSEALFGSTFYKKILPYNLAPELLLLLLVQLDLVKTRQQCGTRHAIHMIVASVIREKGPAGFFSGLVSILFFPIVIFSKAHLGHCCLFEVVDLMHYGLRRVQGPFMCR